MISTAMGEVKCASALETGADYIVSNDSSCLMHIQGLLRTPGEQRLKTIHLAGGAQLQSMNAPVQQFKRRCRAV